MAGILGLKDDSYVQLVWQYGKYMSSEMPQRDPSLVEIRDMMDRWKALVSNEYFYALLVLGTKVEDEEGGRRRIEAHELTCFSLALCPPPYRV